MRLILLAVLLIQTTVSIPPLQIRGIECSCDGEICTESYCFLTAKRPNLNLSSFGLFVAQRQASAFTRIQFYNYYDGNYVPVGPTYSEDLCNMHTSRSRPYSYVLLQSYMKPQTVNFVCPLKNNASLSDFPPIALLFPSFISTRNYKLKFSIGSIVTNKTFFSVSMFMYTTWV